MRKLAIIALLLTLLIACVPALPHPSDNVNVTELTNGETPKQNETMEPEETPENETMEEPVEKPEETELEPASDIPVKTVTEGDLVSFPNLQATDPDGDPITYTFTSPLNTEGTWQTAEGDAGEYVVTITASDGVNTVNQEVRIVVEPANKPPVIEIEDTLEFAEGDTITLEPTITDPDGDEVSVTYSGYMDTNTKELGYEDEGNYKVVITAADGVNTASKDVLITVANTNRAPTINSLSPVTIKEGESVSISPTGQDPDGDSITYTYDFPLDENGQWTTELGDAGDYDITVLASDGEDTTETTVLVTVEPLNRAPVIELSSPVTVQEGKTVTLEPIITDKEGDEVRVSYTGWMTSSTKTTTYDDAGEHDVAIIARDTAGNEARLDIVVVVEDVNRPPVFGAGAFN